MSGLLPLFISISVMWLYDSNCAILPEKSENRVAVEDENSGTEDPIRELEDDFMQKVMELFIAKFPIEGSFGDGGKAAITDSLITETLQNTVKDFTENVINRNQLRFVRESNNDPKFFFNWADKFSELISTEVPHDPVDFEQPTTTSTNLSG